MVEKERESQIWELLDERCSRCRNKRCEGYQSGPDCDPVKDIMSIMEGKPTVDELDRIISDLKNYLSLVTGR